MNQYDLQKELFRRARIRSGSPPHWVAELSKLLNKSRFSIYKKLAGTTALTFDEWTTISKHYTVGIDGIIHDRESIVLECMPISRHGPPQSLSEKILTILDAGDKWENGHLTVLAGGVPHGYLAKYPQLFYYIERNKSLFIPADRFICDDDPQINSSRRLASLQKLHKRYKNISRTEFWNVQILNRFIQRIQEQHAGSSIYRTECRLDEELSRQLEFLAADLEEACSSSGKTPVEIHATKMVWPSTTYIWTFPHDNYPINEFYVAFDEKTWFVGHTADGNKVWQTQLESLKRDGLCLSSYRGKDFVLFFHHFRKSLSSIQETVFT